MVELSKKISKLVGKTNAEYGLIKEGDKVLVGFSGGKDSTTLLHALKHLQRVAPFKFEFKAVTVTYGMGEQIQFLSDHCKKYEIEHEIVDTEIFEIAGEKIRKNSSFCSFFSRMRRGYLYTTAQEQGYNKLALGHHLDDAMESFFMNFLYNGALRSMPPIYQAENGLEVIRPLIFCRERQLRAFAQSNEISVIGDEACPAMRFDIKMPHAREKTKKLLEQMEEENPQMFISMKAAFNNIQTSTFFQKEFLDNNKQD
ncbi:tRNA 2-thiocytidine biosynthesis TtcA family protein [Malaciobacter marinus]|uniref:tRNA 2-thiocytidine(32) synthetase TtcA n=1 Tax=Malaciobacter marinus TaxID=505249 RepID=A0A1T5B2T4_9BACT|nr:MULTISPECIES: ATP-binding protein [Malaciobacter]AXX87191.1 tRNA cytosine32 2-sulfurtransferase [Malaciobacter marinus]PHO12721.1 tRNA 2-thiocytidine(32) synthetase TtcA [Malaciobacter marinus]PHO14852.1 tRNA 2-thiocytidine(32) synthetase TtcA [Malaciobacter marinus]PPK60791.1 tRNA(Ile)-lysidine synthetase-like protein [Malaciobacter marinus]RYA23003.1 tRNA 2-thiocytidine(32) synthetase TtcA [Malaciobacter halophilus]